MCSISEKLRMEAERIEKLKKEKEVLVVEDIELHMEENTGEYI